MRLIDGDVLIAWIKESQQMTSKVRNIICKIETMPSAGRPSAVDLSSVYSTAYKSGYEKSKADRTQGEWLKDENGDYRCSECGGCEEQFIYGTENWYGRGESKFCPSCGARMKGADDED